MTHTHHPKHSHEQSKPEAATTDQGVGDNLRGQALDGLDQDKTGTANPKVLYAPGVLGELTDFRTDQKEGGVAGLSDSSSRAFRKFLGVPDVGFDSKFYINVPPGGSGLQSDGDKNYIQGQVEIKTRDRYDNETKDGKTSVNFEIPIDKSADVKPFQIILGHPQKVQVAVDRRTDPDLCTDLLKISARDDGQAIAFVGKAKDGSFMVIAHRNDVSLSPLDTAYDHNSSIYLIKDHQIKELNHSDGELSSDKSRLIFKVDGKSYLSVPIQDPSISAKFGEAEFTALSRAAGGTVFPAQRAWQPPTHDKTDVLNNDEPALHITKNEPGSGEAARTGKFQKVTLDYQICLPPPDHSSSKEDIVIGALNGWKAQFDSSSALNPGFREIIEGMQEGGYREGSFPAKMAFPRGVHDKGVNVDPEDTIIFKVRLVKVEAGN